MLTPFTHYYPYNINISTGVFSVLYDYIKRHYDFSQVYILLDENIKEFCFPILIRDFPIFNKVKRIQISSGESFKSIESCKFIWDELTNQKATRKSLFINLGGGVICDLGGFSASTYKRGVDFVNIPTTLMSMVDSSGGGKLGIDYGGLKNQIGLFANPKYIFINPNFLKTLPKKELLSGYSEVIKHALIVDKSYWEKLENKSPVQINWENIIKKSIKVKSRIVYNDPYERNERKKLNFGHTIAHSLESYSLTCNTKVALLH